MARRRHQHWRFRANTRVRWGQEMCVRTSTHAGATVVSPANTLFFVTATAIQLRAFGCEVPNSNFNRRALKFGIRNTANNNGKVILSRRNTVSDRDQKDLHLEGESSDRASRTNSDTKQTKTFASIGNRGAGHAGLCYTTRWLHHVRTPLS